MAPLALITTTDLVVAVLPLFTKPSAERLPARMTWPSLARVLMPLSS